MRNTSVDSAAELKMQNDYGTMWDVTNRGSMESLGLHKGKKTAKANNVALSVSNPVLKFPRSGTTKRLKAGKNEDLFEAEPSYTYAPAIKTRNVSQQIEQQVEE